MLNCALLIIAVSWEARYVFFPSIHDVEQFFTSSAVLKIKAAAKRLLAITYDNTEIMTGHSTDLFTDSCLFSSKNCYPSVKLGTITSTGLRSPAGQDVNSCFIFWHSHLFGGATTEVCTFESFKDTSVFANLQSDPDFAVTRFLLWKDRGFRDLSWTFWEHLDAANLAGSQRQFTEEQTAWNYWQNLTRTVVEHGNGHIKGPKGRRLTLQWATFEPFVLRLELIISAKVAFQNFRALHSAELESRFVLSPSQLALRMKHHANLLADLLNQLTPLEKLMPPSVAVPDQYLLCCNLWLLLCEAILGSRTCIRSGIWRSIGLTFNLFKLLLLCRQSLFQILMPLGKFPISVQRGLSALVTSPLLSFPSLLLLSGICMLVCMHPCDQARTIGA